MRYIPLTDADQKAMLGAIEVQSIEELFASIPTSIRQSTRLSIPSTKTEFDLHVFFENLAKNNDGLSSKGWLSFLGAGAYEHFIPTVVDALSSRGEFVTSYTPYQPEVSQGTLGAIFEFQSLIANLLGHDVANASMYDGASATAEAVLMALRIRARRRIYVSKGVHPEYLEVIRNYLRESDVEISELELDTSGRTIVPSLPKGEVIVVVSQPNFFGVIEDLSPIAKAVHEGSGLLTVVTSQAMAFGALKSPGSQDADIVAGEGQSLGNSLSFGGPYLGLMASRMEYVRQLPGRLVGKTVDRGGREGYVLTLATREQHIRREKATSNICTNHSLCALRACIYLATLGERGLRDIAMKNIWAGNRLRKKLLELKGVQPLYTGPIFNEFSVRLPISTDAFLSRMEEERIFGGISLSRWSLGGPNDLLIAVTETKNESDIDKYVTTARKIV